MSDATRNDSAPPLAGASVDLSRGQNLLLRASAGTGKTHQLVERYVRWVVEDGLRPEAIVVITFTRKAAAELGRRIEARLLAAGAPAAALAALPTAPIDNFHGLALRLLGQHAAAAAAGITHATLSGLAATTNEVLGESDEDAHLFVEATESAWLGQTNLAKDLRQLAAQMAVDSAGLATLWQALSRAREDGQTVTAALWGADYAPTAARAQADATQRALHARVVKEGPAAATTAAAKTALLAFSATPPPAQDAPLGVWARGWSEVWANLNLRTSLRNVVDKASRDDALAMSKAAEAEAACAVLQPAWRRLLVAAWQAYGQAKARQHARDFADLVADVIAQLQAVPALHLALRRGVQAVMVDEAQDTNAVQRDFVHLLAGLAGPAANLVAPAQLLVVGDWKQCIYTFRGADPANFDRFAGDVLVTGGRDETLAESYRSLPALVEGINALGVHLFGDRYEPLVARHNGVQSGVQLAGQSIVQNIVHSTEQVNEQSSAHLTPGMHWLPVVRADAKAATVADEAEATAELIATALAKGTAPSDVAVLLVKHKNAPLFARALAARGVPVVTAGGRNLYAQAEIRQWLALLAWLSDETAELQAAVALRSPWLQLPEDALWAVLSPQARANGALAALRRGDAGPARATLQQAARGSDGAAATADAAADDNDAGCTAAVQVLGEVAAVLPQLVAIVERLAPTDALVALERVLDVDAVLAVLPDAPERRANFARLHELAERAEKRGRQSTVAFAADQLRRMAAGIRQSGKLAADGGDGAVTLSTVHASKGLQWDMVVLPALASKPSAQQPAVLYHRGRGLVFAPTVGVRRAKSLRYDAAVAEQKAEQEAQLRRLLYVAVTRAKSRVVFVAPAEEIKAAETQKGTKRKATPTGGADEEGGAEQKAKAGSSTFAALLGPWRQRKPSALHVRPSIVATTVVSQPPKTPSAAEAATAGDALTAQLQAVTGPRQLPPGTTLHVSVTQLVHADRPAPAGRKTGLATLVQEAVAPDALAAFDEQTQGTLAHEALAYAMEAADGPAAVAKYLAYRGLCADDALFGRLYRDLERFLRGPLGQLLANLGASARRHEWPFVLRREVQGVAGVLRGKIDLLAWHQGAPLVVDFKYAFRRPNAQAYLHQLDTYAWAASSLCGYDGPIPCALVYLRDTDGVVAHTADADRQAEAEARLRRFTTQAARCDREPTVGTLDWPGQAC